MAQQHPWLAAGGSTTPPDQQRDREIAFQNWLHSTETAFLECRNKRHISRSLTDPDTKLEVRQGQCHIETTCPRCGTVIKSVVSVRGGYLEGPHKVSSYEYPDGYLLPKEATGTGGHAMDKEHKGQARLEVIDRAFMARGTSLKQEAAKAARRESSARARARKKEEPPY